MASPPKRRRDRFSVNEVVYHRIHGEAVKEYRHVFWRDLETTEQVFERRCTVGETPQPLDLGWLGDCVGQLCISNAEGPRNFEKNPTPEELAEVMSRWIEVFHGDTLIAYVPPTESLRFYPACARALRVRCRSGSARFLIRVFPR